MLKSGKILCCALVAILVFSLPAGAFFSFFKKKKPKEAVHINEEFLVQKNLEIDGELYPARIAVYIPRSDESVKVSILYDELLHKPVTSIKWITESQSKHSKEPKYINPYKNEIQVLKQMEQLALVYDPSSAYDRVVEDKHVINKSFFFNKTEIFTNTEKPFAHFLVLEFTEGIKEQLRIDEQIYLKPEQILTPQTAGKSQKAPVVKPNRGDIKPPAYLRPAVQKEAPKPNPAAPLAQPEATNLSDEDMQELYEFEQVKQQLHTQQSQYGQNNPNDIELKKQMLEMQMMLQDGLNDEDGGEEGEIPLF